MWRNQIEIDSCVWTWNRTVYTEFWLNMESIPNLGCRGDHRDACSPQGEPRGSDGALWALGLQGTGCVGMVSLSFFQCRFEMHDMSDEQICLAFWNPFDRVVNLLSCHGEKILKHLKQIQKSVRSKQMWCKWERRYYVLGNILVSCKLSCYRSSCQAGCEKVNGPYQQAERDQSLKAHLAFVPHVPLWENSAFVFPFLGEKDMISQGLRQPWEVGEFRGRPLYQNLFGAVMHLDCNRVCFYHDPSVISCLRNRNIIKQY